MSKRILVAATSMLFVLSMPHAHAEKISGTHGRNEIKNTCEAVGGSYWRNLDTYGCLKTNCDGKGNSCSVTCKQDGKCEGHSPVRAQSQGSGSRTSPGDFLLR